MNKENTQKVMTLSFVALAVVAWIVAGVLLNTASATWGVVARLADQDIVRHGVPFALAIATWASLQFNAKVKVFAEEVIVEVSKVVWPSRRDTTAMTIVVCVMVIVSAVVIAVFDSVSGYLLNYFIRV